MRKFNRQAALWKEILEALSPDRLEPYLNSAKQDRYLALALYRWNQEISGELFKVISVFETTLRVSLAGVLEARYGQEWFRSESFARSLGPTGQKYGARGDLEAVRRKAKVQKEFVSRLSFAFWEELLTSKHVGRLWDSAPGKNLLSVYESSGFSRTQLLAAINRVRRIRNRIAHHEPIYTADLQSVFGDLTRMIGATSSELNDWLVAKRKISRVLSRNPLNN